MKFKSRASTDRRTESLNPNETARENETLGSKYSQEQLKDLLESASGFRDAFDKEVKLRRKEDRRRLVVDWIAGLLAFFGINGSFFILVYLSGILDQLHELGLPGILTVILLVGLWIAYSIALAKTFFWFSDKTGFYDWVEDWIESWDTLDIHGSNNIINFKSFPRKQRKELAKRIESDLDTVRARLYDLERAADDKEDEKLSDSLERINRLVFDISHACNGLVQHRVSWKYFALTLEKVCDDFELELADIENYHKLVQPLSVPPAKPVA